MEAPGWSTTEPTVAGDLTLLPRNATWRSEPVGLVSEVIRNVTNGGVREDTVMWDREVFDWQFRFPKAYDAQFRAMFVAARSSDIWYVPDSSDMSVKYNVRSEDKDYLPRNIGQPGAHEGDMSFWLDWTFRIST